MNHKVKHRVKREFDGRPDNAKSMGTSTFSKTKMAEQAGLSKDRQNQASRFANIPSDQFELMVDAETMRIYVSQWEKGKVLLKYRGVKFSSFYQLQKSRWRILPR